MTRSRIASVVSTIAWLACVIGGRGGGASAQPAPVNPYNGTQEREEIFEFAANPEVKKDGKKCCNRSRISGKDSRKQVKSGIFCKLASPSS